MKSISIVYNTHESYQSEKSQVNILLGKVYFIVPYEMLKRLLSTVHLMATSCCDCVSRVYLLSIPLQTSPFYYYRRSDEVVVCQSQKLPNINRSPGSIMLTEWLWVNRTMHSLLLNFVWR